MAWNDLIMESGATPLPLDDQRFRSWMSRQRVFVSSVMDDEMGPARAALRTWLRKWGAAAEMWEELAPRDQHPRGAYLAGVDRSTLYVLLAGTSYGVKDETGFSPTHQEGERARERGIPRLLMENADTSGERDGYLKRWVGGLYREISGGQYRSPEELINALEARLREMASAEATPWIKLGQLVLPGRVLRRGGSRGEITVTTTVRNGALRRAVSDLGILGGRVRVDRLTWGVETLPIGSVSAEIETAFTTEDQVTLTCSLPHQHYGRDSGIIPALYNGGGTDSQVELWARHMLFGEPVGSRAKGYDLLLAMSVPSDVPTLPEVLASHQAQGWAAEGLVRLYAVEELLTRHGGHFDHLDVGPATAAGVRLEARYTPAGHAQRSIHLGGIVPLN